VNLDEKPAWSRAALKRLGEALANGMPSPADCPEYGEVMDWHNELASEVATQISSGSWATMPADQLDVSARPKTIDTLVQKLQRESFSLADVQDLAGVRIDANLNLTQQTQLAQEIAHHFGVPDNLVRDLRDSPHSGYRAVHVWIRKPAGRVEVQIRTVAQSAWANAYERLGDRFGREIRYGGVHDRPEVQRLVSLLHDMSASVAAIEEREAQIVDITAKLEHARRLGDEVPKLSGRLLLALLFPSGWNVLPSTLKTRWKLRQLRRGHAPMQRTVDELTAKNLASRATYVESLEDLRRRLDGDRS
jgi:ppGpp synthetase/RelA/SpoT-type nucleotidyltranferase